MPDAWLMVPDCEGKLKFRRPCPLLSGKVQTRRMEGEGKRVVDLLVVCGWKSWWSAMMCENQSAKGPCT